MTEKRFSYNVNKNTIEQDGKFVAYVNSVDGVRIANKLNVFQKENEELRNNLEDWIQRTLKAHEYFNLLEEIIDEVCNDDISNEIWKVYEERERLIE